MPPRYGERERKTLLAAVATAAFAAGAVADDTVYHGLAESNPDLLPTQVTMDSVVAAQPGVGDSFDRYHGLEEGNNDLFATPKDSGDRPVSKNPNIYGGFRSRLLSY